MSVDVEEHFQVSAFEGTVQRSDWETIESRVSQNTERLLETFDQAGVRATFFVLGWVAERYPGLVRQIANGGHELASHGYAHRLIYANSVQAFREDIRRARLVLEDAVGLSVHGYRAPSFSITRRTLWALDVLLEEGYTYDASIYPIHHDRYGIPDWPRDTRPVACAGGTIWEVPGSTIRVGGVNLPIGGGGYFRLLPYAWTRLGIRWLNERERLPAVFYVHPWEVDPDQPRLPGSLVSRIRHYRNLSDTERRLRRLVSEFAFAPIREVFQLGSGLQTKGALAVVR